jgi:predicted metal-dependent hydrolase
MSDQSIPSSPPDVAIELRRMNFRFSPSIPVHWARGNKFITHWFNALSATFPPTEKHMIDSIRAYEDQLTDPELREQVRVYVGQEAHHSFQHRALNSVIAKAGIDMQGQDQWTRRLLEKIWNHSRPDQRLALSVSLEHFTTVYSDQLLRDPENLRGFEDRVGALWRWHAIEETEHKSVLYDVFQRVSGRYLPRFDLQFWVTLFLIPIFHLVQFRLMRSDRSRGGLKDMIKGLWYLYVRPGSLRKLIPGYLRGFRPSFHPWQHDNSELLRPWKQTDEAKYRMRIGELKSRQPSS